MYKTLLKMQPLKACLQDSFAFPVIKPSSTISSHMPCLFYAPITCGTATCVIPTGYCNSCAFLILRMQVYASSRPLLHLFYTDPCDPNPCFQGRKCTAKSETEFECEPCPDGYVGDGQECEPDNEVSCV